VHKHGIITPPKSFKTLNMNLGAYKRTKSFTLATNIWLSNKIRKNKLIGSTKNYESEIHVKAFYKTSKDKH
jgi:hypothetical protein